MRPDRPTEEAHPASTPLPTGGQHALGRGLERLPGLCAAGCDVPAHVQRFYFLRHGQTARNALRIYQSVDEPLNATGRAQAEQAAQVLAAELAGEAQVRIVCSDAPRAHTTAQAVALQLQSRQGQAGNSLNAGDPSTHGLLQAGLQPSAVVGLRERHFGTLIGTSSADIDWDCAPDGGETLDQFVTRTLAALAEAVAHPAPVLVVAHGGTLHVLAAALGVSASPALLANAQPLRFDREGQGWRVTPLGVPQPAGAPVNLA